jgi:hypothetical protein
MPNPIKPENATFYAGNSTLLVEDYLKNLYRETLPLA